MNERRQTLLSSAGLLVLRAGIGGYMAVHGFGKLKMLLGGQASNFADPIGLGPAFTLFFAVFAEFLCSLLVVVGLATRIAAIPPVLVMATAAFVVHGGDPWVMTGQGGSKEPALLFLAGFLAIALLGPGDFSLDRQVLPSLRRSKP